MQAMSNRALNTSTGLAARLKEATRDLHRQAERSGLMADLMQGRISRQAYCLLLRGLQPVYAALEAGLDIHRHDPNLQRLWQPSLRRLPALEQDLSHFAAGQDWRDSWPEPACASAYALRLTELSQSAPALLTAHAYLRYLGDLHGGQMLAGRVGKRFALQGGQGTAFYAFAEGDLQALEKLKQDFRTGLDAMEFSSEQTDAIVAEACEGFRLHGRMFEEIQRQACLDSCVPRFRSPVAVWLAHRGDGPKPAAICKNRGAPSGRTSNRLKSESSPEEDL